MSPLLADTILVGHNPFFGIDHRCRVAGNEKAQRFENPQEILKVLHTCHELGLRGMMMSTHPMAQLLCNQMQREGEPTSGWRIYPLVPYLQRYVREANTKGLIRTVLDALGGGDSLSSWSWILQGGRSLLTREIRPLLTQLIDQELSLFKGRPLGAVFLHDGLTDLALGLGIESVLEIFSEHVGKGYGVPAGFATKNLPLLRDRWESRGWRNLLAMASFNSRGFFVNPSLQACQEALLKPGLTLVAMNSLASGAIPPEEAYPFLARFPSIRAVVVGFSREDHARQTIGAIRKSFQDEGSVPAQCPDRHPAADLAARS